MGLFRLLFFVAAAVMAYLIFQRLSSKLSGRSAPDMSDERLGRLVQDPHCKVYVDSQEAVKRKVHQGVVFFCSEKCAKEYMAARKAGEPTGTGQKEA